MDEFLGDFREEDGQQSMLIEPDAMEKLLKLGEAGNTMADALTKFQSQLGSFTKVDRKAAVSEKRKVNMKWCEEQRQHLQGEYDQLKSVRDLLISSKNNLIEDCSNRVRVINNVIKMLEPNECSGPMPPEVQEKTSQVSKRRESSKRKKNQ